MSLVASGSATARRAARQPALAACQSKRSVHQMVIHPNTGSVHVAEGPSGRHAKSGHVATVFGASGFLGRYLVSKLAKAGTQVIVPYRDADEVRHLKVTGDLGQVVPMEWDMNNDTQIEECLRHSDTVYNLTGRDYETKNFSFSDVNVSGARRIARIAELSGVSRLIHVSHYNAAHDSPSAYYRTKFEGEQVVKDAFNDVTIVKPTWMYGHEDRLLNTLAVSPSIFRINNLDTKIKPVHVMDVASALNLMIRTPSTAASTFALPGPKEYTFNELMTLTEALTLTKLQGPEWPRWALKLASRAWDKIWWPTLSPDEVNRRFMDDLDLDAQALGYKGFADLGIEPDVLEDIAIVYLRRYRGSSYYDLPIAKGGIKLRSQSYHVVE